jgi:uncharacterized protein (DUF362 family)
MKDSKIYVNGIEPVHNVKSFCSNVEEVFLKTTHDLEWLSAGDVVLLKPALNSPNPYPSTTHPLSVHIISKILNAHGAKVVVGDQSGIRSVLHHPGGVIRGNTKDNYIKAGMGKADDKSFISFEKEGWNEGFYHYKSSKTPSWQDGFYITRWIQKADHIINLPRLSTHTQAGATLGFKNMVGFLREDSRLEFHANGPYNVFIKFNARGSSLKSADDHTNTFLEKIVEISDSLRDKLRLTFFIANKAQTTFGPDSQILKLGKIKIARAHVSRLKPGLVFASSDPVATESFALALLKYLRKNLSILPRLYEQIILITTNNTKKLDNIPVKDHPYIQHSINLGLGKIASDIEYRNVPEDIQRNLNNTLNSS